MSDQLRSYRCENCGKEFHAANPIEEVEAQYKAEFPNMPISERVIVCDYCYRFLMQQWQAMKS